jgi:cytochrome P450
LNYLYRFAGSDTTAIAFRSTLYHLMKNPTTLAKAHAEIDTAIRAGSLSSPIKYAEATTKLPYICAAIKEAMRMHPSVGLSIPRYAPQEGIELAGRFISKGYRIGINPAVVHYDRDVFGADADEFRPERWLVGEDDWRAMDRNLLIFGAGTRTCIGKNVGLSIAVIWTVSVTDICRYLWSSFTRLYRRCCDTSHLK